MSEWLTINAGPIHADCRIICHTDRKKSAAIPKLLVDTGSEYTWIAAEMLRKIGISPEKKDLQFVMANGQMITRPLGFAIIRVQGIHTTDEVVFAEPGDLQLLGARTLEGLNLRVDAQQKKLVAGGPAAGGDCRLRSYPKIQCGGPVSDLAVTHICCQSPRGHLRQRLKDLDQKCTRFVFVPDGTAECSHR
jgi:predicted aspartyl protease